MTGISVPVTLPAEQTGRRRRAAVRFAQFSTEYLIALPLACVIALVWANTDPESYFTFAHNWAFTVNQVLIVFLFGILTKQVVEATLPNGSLHTFRRAALPCMAGIGGLIVPIVIYILFLNYWGEFPLREAWVTSCAVDIAAVYLVTRSIFGRHPAVPFVLLAAISANAIGVVLIAFFHPVGKGYYAMAAGLMALALATSYSLQRAKVRNFWPYLIAGGSLSWAAFYVGGIQPALALVPIVPFMPRMSSSAGLFADMPAGAHDTLTEFERFWRGPLQLILFLFGLVNAGVPLHGQEPGFWALPMATIVGRPIGVVLAVGLGVLAGMHRPTQIGWRDLIVIGFATSVGLSMALFFATSALPIGSLLVQAKLGSLLTAGGALVALLAAVFLGVGRIGRLTRPRKARP